jgi:hypothetical protein
MRGMNLLPLLLTRRTALLSAGTLGLLALTAPARAAERTWTSALVGSGVPVRETRALAGFDAVRLRGAFDAVLRQGPTAVEVRGDDNLVPLVETSVVDAGGRRVLELRLKHDGSVRPRSSLAVHVAAPAWQSVVLDGSGDVEADGIDARALEIALVGSGDLRLRGVTAGSIALRLRGSGDVHLAGSARSLGVTLQGSGDVWADGLAADEVRVAIAGSGDARVHAQRSLQASVAGSGDVRYRGAPTLDVRIAGSGTVARL